MGKIKSILIKVKSKATVKSYQKPLVLTILLLLFLNLLVIFVGSIVAFNLDDNNIFDGSWINAFGEAFKWMISANSINNVDYNFRMKIIAAVVIGLEMILFSGAMIATLTTALRSFVDKMSKAKGKIDIDNHFVILNWNSKVPEMVNNLLIKGFKESVLILSDKDKDFVTAQINSVKEKSKNKINLIVKEGNPLLHSTLEDISISKASNVVVMSREDMPLGDDENISNSDLNSLKILLALGNFKYKDTTNIVVEMDSEASIEKINDLSKTLGNLKNKSIIPVSFNKKIGQIIAQTVLTPEMANIYFDLLSYDGVEFYSYGTDDVDKYLKTHSDAIPIIKYDKLWVMADDAKDLGTKRTGKVKEQKLTTKDHESRENSTVFVIGNNKKSEFILENLHIAASYAGSRLEIKDYKKDEVQKLISDIKVTEGVKKVLILSDDKVSYESYDANIFVTLIALQTAFPERENLSFITELLDSRNLNSVKDFNIHNAIISNKIISLLITQLALNQDSKRFFDNLFLSDDAQGGEVFDINVDLASDIIDFKDKLVFNTSAEFIHSFYHSCDKDCMAFGIIKNDEIIYLAKGQDIKKELVIEPNDKIVYINY